MTDQEAEIFIAQLPPDVRATLEDVARLRNTTVKQALEDVRRLGTFLNDPPTKN